MGVVVSMVFSVLLLPSLMRLLYEPSRVAGLTAARAA
jgi:hypothetical protein